MNASAKQTLGDFMHANIPGINDGTPEGPVEQHVPDLQLDGQGSE